MNENTNTTTNKFITDQTMEDFKDYLIREEKSAATVEKYIRDTKEFFYFVKGKVKEKVQKIKEVVEDFFTAPTEEPQKPEPDTPPEDPVEITKDLILAWKESLIASCAPRTVNAKLASLNSLLYFIGCPDLKAKNLKIQQQTYASTEEELTLAEYYKLLEAAENQPQLHLIMETICGTGIRVSELQFFTVEAVKLGTVKIYNKGKNRVVLLQGKLKQKLRDWAKKQGIKSGPLFITKYGKPVDRSNIWAKMKKLCEAAGVLASKVFPHNLRKLFARRFYDDKKDIAKLADVLGHTSINTTRIYIMTTGEEHLKTLDHLGLVV